MCQIAISIPDEVLFVKYDNKEESPQVEEIVLKYADE
jgi:hypothetical protein